MSVHRLTKGSAIFLFPHQDDEVGIFQKIIDEQNNGNEIFCLYFTRSLDNKKNLIRELESLHVLLDYGVKRKNVLFVGRLLDIEDKNLCSHILKAKKWLDGWLSNHPSVSNIYVPAWEGGHPDHDCLYAIAATLLTQENFKNKVWQFPLYNAKNCPPYFYRIQSALEENGEITKSCIGLIARIQHIKNCLRYPSQAISWLGLFPFFLFNYLILGKQTLQPVQLDRIHARPHDGALYYEVRNFGSWKNNQTAINKLLRYF